jgi:hypothetical protein
MLEGWNSGARAFHRRKIRDAIIPKLAGNIPVAFDAPSRVRARSSRPTSIASTYRIRAPANTGRRARTRRAAACNNDRSRKDR